MEFSGQGFKFYGSLGELVKFWGSGFRMGRASVSLRQAALRDLHNGVWGCGVSIWDSGLRG